MFACRLVNADLEYSAVGRTVMALRGISLGFEKNSFWAVLGTSGSGKSSLLNLLGCLDWPTGGRYYIGGVDVVSLDDNQLSDIRLKNIGFVFQSFHLIPQLTVRENIELPLVYCGKSRWEITARSTELAEQVGLGDRLNHRPQQLSGGQQQRTAIARAMANSPEILLADEPTGNLDSVTSQQIMELLAKLNCRGTTIIMVTHEQSIANWAEKKLFLHDGRIDRIES